MRIVESAPLMLCPTIGIIVHSLARRVALQSIGGAHKGKIAGICMATGDRLLSCGHDRNIKLWGLKLPNMGGGEEAIDASQDDGTEGSSRKLQGMWLDETEDGTSLGKPILIYPSKVPLKYASRCQCPVEAQTFVSQDLTRVCL